VEQAHDQDHVTVRVKQVNRDVLVIYWKLVNVAWAFVTGPNGQWHLPVRPFALAADVARQHMSARVQVELVPALVLHQAVWNVIWLHVRGSLNGLIGPSVL